MGGGGYHLKSGCAKICAFQEKIKGGGVKVVWRNSDLDGFSYMSLYKKVTKDHHTIIKINVKKGA